MKASGAVPSLVARLLDSALEATVAASFSRVGPAVRSWAFGWDDSPDGALDGQTVIVTGASSGIGEALARMLVAAGAEVHLVGRDTDKLARVANDLRTSVAGAQVTEHGADLGSLDDVRTLAATLANTLPRVDVLVHVAGALVHQRQTTSDGIELTFQVHVVAPHLLTTSLLPQLEAARGRVITVTSGGMYTQRLDVDALIDPPEPFDGTRTYARAKRAQVEMTAQWARSHAGTGVGFHVMHPGWVATPGLEASLPSFSRLLRPLLRTPAIGADTAYWLAWSPEATAPGGDLWLDRRRRRTVAIPGTQPSPAEVGRLWSTVDQLAGDIKLPDVVEMIEAVDWRELDDFVSHCARLVGPQGAVAYQAIVVASQRWSRARVTTDFIKSHVFPGGNLPSVPSILDAATRSSDLALVDLIDFGPDYAETLRRWRGELDARVEDARALGLDDSFLRLWEFYLCYCEAGFEERQVSVVQMVLGRPGRSGSLAPQRLMAMSTGRLTDSKKSLPLSSTTMNAGKSCTSIFHTASIPSSGYSSTSTLVMQSWAKRAAGPPIDPR